MRDIEDARPSVMPLAQQETTPALLAGPMIRPDDVTTRAVAEMRKSRRWIDTDWFGPSRHV